MSQRGLLRVLEHNQIGFWCPGCKEYHIVNVGDGSPSWSFDGDYDKPTLQPSVLTRSGHYVPHWSGKQCWCTYNKENPDDPVKYECTQCHLFLQAGMLQFLSDCSHEFAGKTVALTVGPKREGIE